MGIPMKMKRLLPAVGIVTLATPITSAGEQTFDFLNSPGLEHFQPADGWQRVERAVAVPDRMEISTKGHGKILANRSTKDISIPYLMTRESFGDVRVELEFMIPEGSNAGVYLMGRYEVQILDSFGKDRVGSGDLGGIYARWDPSLPADRQWSGGSAPLANAAKAPGTWQTMEIVFRAPRFDELGGKTSGAGFDSVRINGVLVQENTQAPGPTASNPLPGEVASGPIVIQGDHGPIAIRRFTATPLTGSGSTGPAELDAYWAEVSRAVNEGDFEAYQATCHDLGVIISGSKQMSQPLRHALARWKSDFEKTKAGEVESEVLFRFAHRYRDETTAHESGVFRYTARPKDGEPTVEYIDFEALLTKVDGDWKMLMENQKAKVTRAEWDALAP